MPHRKPEDMSDRELLIRLDERVGVIHHEVVPKVRRHEAELLVGKVLLAAALVLAAVKYPVIAEALGKVLQ